METFLFSEVINCTEQITINAPGDYTFFRILVDGVDQVPLDSPTTHTINFGLPLTSKLVKVELQLLSALLQENGFAILQENGFVLLPE